MTTSSNSIEKFRNQLKSKQVSDFFDSIKNEENPDAEMHSLCDLSSQVMKRMHEIQSSKVAQLMAGEEICPGCLIGATLELQSIKQMVQSFNSFVGQPDCYGGEESSP